MSRRQPAAGGTRAALASGSPLVRTSLLLLPVQIVLRGAEAALPVLLAIWFGRTAETDIYTLTAALFTFAGSLLFAAHHDSALIPILAEAKLRDRAQLPSLVGSLLLHTLVLGGVLSVLVGLASLAWMHLRFAGTERAIAFGMILPFCLYLVAFSVRTFLIALLQSERRFVLSGLGSAFAVLTSLAFIAAARHPLGVLSIPVAALVGELVAIGWLSWMAVSIVGWRFAWSFARPEPIRRLAAFVASEAGGSAATRLNPVVDQLMAGLAGVVGGGTLLRYSGDVSTVPTGILQATLLPVMLSHLSEHFAHRDLATIASVVRRTLLWAMGLLILASLVLLAVGRPLLRLVFLHGAMDEAGIERMASLLPYHLVGLAPFGALLILARAHVAVQNSPIMLSMGLLNAGLNIALNLLLLPVLGLEGIALSTSLVHLAVAAVFWHLWRRRLAALAGA